jgi:hypothetical protein
LNVSALFELHIVIMFVSQDIFNTEIAILCVGPSTPIFASSGWLGRGDGMILSTVPGMMALGCSGIRAVSKFSSAIFADLATRGFAISFLTLACVALSGSFLLLLWSMH